MTLKVKCPNGDHSFATRAISMDEMSFQTCVISDMSEPCPICNKMVTYSKKDMFFEKVSK